MNDMKAGQSAIGGQASHTTKVTIEEGAALLKSQGGSLKAEITVTRAGTGKVEHFTLDMTPKEP